MEMMQVLPQRGEVALVRQRKYLVENVTAAPAKGQATLVELCRAWTTTPKERR